MVTYKLSGIQQFSHLLKMRSELVGERINVQRGAHGIKELKYHVTASALYFLPPGIEMKLFQCFSFSPLLICFSMHSRLASYAYLLY